MNKHCSGNIAVSFFFVLTGIALLISACRIKTGAVIGLGGDFLPKLMTVIWLLISALIFIGEIKKPAENTTEGRSGNFTATLFLLTAYFCLIYPIGFVAASIFYTFIQILLFAPKDAKSKKHYVAYAVIAIVIP